LRANPRGERVDDGGKTPVVRWSKPKGWGAYNFIDMPASLRNSQ
jgi:hypothetical protein